MLAHRASRVRVTLALTALTLFTPSADAQSPTARPGNSDKETVAAQGSRLGSQESKVDAEAPKASDLESEVATVKTENAAFREDLRKMNEQQKALLETVERLQRKLDGNAAENLTRADHPVDSSQAASGSATLADAASTQVPSTKAADPTVSSISPPVQPDTPAEDRYRDGILIWQTKGESSVPFQLRFTDITQFRYLNTLATNDTFTDHLGNVRQVNHRNDLTVNREMFTLTGYIFDKRLRYNILTWTSAATTQVVVSGNVAWQFNKAFTLTAGYWSVPGTRSLVFTFPYFTQPERSLADNFFRPGFTQGVWATGEPVKGLNYEFFVGNGLNTLTISSAKIDTRLVYSGSGVTLQEATYRMWAIDAGTKWRGLAINGQYYSRWLNDFVADGPLPLASTFDQGGEFSASYFIRPKKFMVYGRGSGILGQFGSSYEWAGGFKWYYISNQRLWLQGEAMRVNKSAYGSIITPYTGGMTGWVPVLQTIFSF
jgi:hypothetical protein